MRDWLLTMRGANHLIRPCRVCALVIHVMCVRLPVYLLAFVGIDTRGSTCYHDSLPGSTAVHFRAGLRPVPLSAITPL